MTGTRAPSRWGAVAIACGALAVAACGPAPEAPRAHDGTAAISVPSASTRDKPATAPRPSASGRRARDGAASDALDRVARADDTFETLLARHGAGSLVRETLPGAEGSEIDGWVLFGSDPARRIEIVPDESARHPRLLIVREGSTWRRADGVRIGLDTRALERLNGRPFEFTGFDWDYGGLVMDWKGGRLSGEGTMVGPVRLCASDTRPDDYPIGDGEFLSSLPVMQRHPAIVCEVGVALDAD